MECTRHFFSSSSIFYWLYYNLESTKICTFQFSFVSQSYSASVIFICHSQLLHVIFLEIFMQTTQFLLYTVEQMHIHSIARSHTHTVFTFNDNNNKLKMNVKITFYIELILHWLSVWLLWYSCCRFVFGSLGALSMCI